MNKLNKLTLPTTILIASFILGSFIFATQVIKQQSIERQQQIKIKQAECEALAAGAIKQWSNVLGVTYDNDVWKECIVTYANPETGEIKTSPLRLMQASE